MEKKYLKKVLTGLSIASLVAGMGGAAMAAGGWGGKKQAAPAPSGWSGTKKGAVSTQVKEEAPAPGYGAEAAKEAAAGYGAEKTKEAAAGYGKAEEAKEAAAGYGTPAPGYGDKVEEKKAE